MVLPKGTISLHKILRHRTFTVRQFTKFVCLCFANFISQIQYQRCVAFLQQILVFSTVNTQLRRTWVLVSLWVFLNTQDRSLMLNPCRYSSCKAIRPSTIYIFSPYRQLQSLCVVWFNVSFDFLITPKGNHPVFQGRTKRVRYNSRSHSYHEALCHLREKQYKYSIFGSFSPFLSFWLLSPVLVFLLVVFIG